jgi:L-alanine-DL-glutamate epimerase-like enolase superfamily enzyme
LGRELEQYNLTWLEEPLPPHDLEGTAAVAAALSTPVASGESEYTLHNFKEMAQTRAADVWMPDLQRAGGVTGFLKVGHLAEALDIPVSNHTFSEYSLQPLGALPNATYLEYMNRMSPLYKERNEFRDGYALVPSRPGWGFTFDMQVVERLRV